MTLTRTTTGWRTSGRAVTRTAQIVALHGDPGDAPMDTTLGAGVRATTGATNLGRSGMLDGLHATGHQISQPWMGACWGTNVDPYSRGGAGLGVVDTVAPSGMVHLIGTSMGGYCSALWASRHPSRVASLTLISPALDVMDIYDASVGKPIVGSLADEIAACWGGSTSATRADILTAVTGADADIATITAGLATIADRVWLVCATDDPFALAPACQTLATDLGLGDRAVLFDTGQPSDRHPAPYRPDLGWDPLTTLRQVDTWR